MLAPYVWAFQRPLDLATLQRAATHVIGTHDFTSFAATDPDLTSRDHSENDAPPDEIEIRPNPEAIISTGGGVLASAVEKPASLPLRPTTNTRTIHHSAWHQQEDLYIYRVTGSGFLHHMVRNLVGTFVQTATGHIPVDDIPKILAAHNRSAAGYTAPARGLFLVEVEYK